MKHAPQELYLIKISEIARIAGVSLKTAKRWKDGTICPPKPVLLLLAGDLGCFDREWRGWIIRNGELVSPEGWCITMSDVRATPLQRSQIAIYQAENRKLRADLEAREFAEDQPLPDSESAILAEVKKLLG